MATIDPARSTQPHRPAVDRRQRARLVAAAVIGALITAFALLNLDQVKVHWLVTTAQTPLIVVIALAFALGMIGDRLLLRVRRKRRSSAR